MAKLRRVLLIGGALTTGLFLVACGLAAGLVGGRSMYEQPQNKVVKKLSNSITIREYGTRLIAESTAEAPTEEKAMNKAFIQLFNYISGENSTKGKVAMTVPVESVRQAEGEKIAMTTPVESNAEPTTQGVSVTMRFFFPEEFTLESAPLPNNPNITVKEIPGETLAVLRKSGTMNPERFAEESAVLLQELEGSEWKVLSAPRLYTWDPPFTPPPLRRNEIIVTVEKATAP
ncbi:MAG: heme-binding protein [Candidatus Sumerlaeia bacterium]|nr:heme-binding protein [Candidatus Sumerlaeia bacterium]